MSDAAPPNPLLDDRALPAFDRIRPEHVEPGVVRLLRDLEADFDALESHVTPTWAGLVEPLERIGDRLARTWGVVNHLLGVANTEALRAAHESVQGDVVRFGLRVAQSRSVFQALEALRGGGDWDALDAAQRRIVEVLLRDAGLAGVGLSGAARARNLAIHRELAELTTRFGNNLLDATQAFALWLRDADQVERLPSAQRELAAQAAREDGEPEATAERGPWRIGLDAPSLIPFLEHSPHRNLRERLYRAYVTRASEGAVDNAPIFERILALRSEQAALLGFACYADQSLASKMAPDVAAVQRFLDQLRRVSVDAARADLEALRAFAASRGAPEADDLELWDVAYWSERLREERFDYSAEALRPYFPLPVVLDGLFALARRLFGVDIEEQPGAAPTWHPDVRFFRVRDADGSERAAFYLDPYSRPGSKRSGAWMDECVGRSALLAPAGQDHRLPVAHLVCNQRPPLDGRPSCMSFEEVLTLFHEFGHGLQHMLTSVDYGLASGIRNVEWDAVELPSQFMENWCYQPEILRDISKHVDTGACLPDESIDKLRSARTFRAGSDMLRQLFFAVTDLELHCQNWPGERSPFELQRQIAERTTVIPPLSEDRSLCAFQHIFGGGYAAGYYSYKWAEVLSADAFARFEEAGLGDAEATARIGRLYRDTVLALGGSRPPMEVFRSFRGREPNPEALLRHAGLEET